MRATPDPSQTHRGSFEDLRPVLLDALEVLEVDDREIALTLLRSELDVVDPPRREAAHRGVNRALNEPDTYYAFHTDDIKLLKEASLVTTGIVGLMMLSKGPIGVVAALVVLVYRYRRRRIQLTGEEGIVLLTLKRAPRGGWTVDELARNLPLRAELDAEQVTAILERMQDIKREDNTRTTLVDHDENRWSAVDV